MSGYERGIFHCASVGSAGVVSLFQPPVFILQVGNRLMKGTDLRQQTSLSHVYYSLELQTWGQWQAGKGMRVLSSVLDERIIP